MTLCISGVTGPHAHGTEAWVALQSMYLLYPVLLEELTQQQGWVAIPYKSPRESQLTPPV